MMEQLFFYAFAIIAVISALCVVSVRSAVHSAFFLVICLLQVAAIFVLLRFPFLAAVQVFIYVGAVMSCSFSRSWSWTSARKASASTCTARQFLPG